MPRYLKYSILALFVASLTYFTFNVVQAMTTPADANIDVLPPRTTVESPDYLITDSNIVPPR